jgi:hypothetical protein
MNLLQSIFRLIIMPGAAISLFAFTTPAEAVTLDGELQIAGSGTDRLVKNVEVTLYEATEFTPVALATTKTDRSGQFSFEVARNSSNSIFFLTAKVDRRVNFVAILGSNLPSSAVINEVTSVASSYAMAQFYRTGQIAGDPFRLRIAAMMYQNIVDPATGAISDVLLRSPNSDQTNSLRLTRSLANLINRCSKSSRATKWLLILTRDGRGRTAGDTAEALANLARNPAKAVKGIYWLTAFNRAYGPVLTSIPDQWTITIKLNNTGRDDMPFGGAANVDWDSWGYAWVANNVTQGTPNSTKYNVVLRPDGKPAAGTAGEPDSPFNTGGLLGVGWGVSVDQNDNVWFGNFGWGTDKNLYFPSQTATSTSGAGTGSVSQFHAVDGSAVSPEAGYFGPYRVQAIESDALGNIWMASFGDRNVAGGSGVWVFRNGNPNDMAFSLVDWEDAPFGVAPVPGGGAAWVTFSGGLAGVNQSYITRYELTESGQVVETFRRPIGKTLKVVAVDYGGNAWFASQGTGEVYAFSPDGRKLGKFSGGGIYGPWGMAVDGEGNVWVSNFGPTEAGNVFDVGRLSKLCGANPAAWPRGLKMGDAISPDTGYTVPSEGEEVLLSNGDPLFGPGAPPSFVPMMRQTSVKIDAAGNAWTINNWKPRFDIDATVNPGGDGIIIFVGLAPPPPFEY